MNDIIMVVIFIFLLIIFCILWNKKMMKIYKKIQSQKNHFQNLKFNIDLDKIIDLKLVGTGNDENGDYEINDAIKNIRMPDNINLRIFKE